MEKITLTPIEKKVLEKCAKRTFVPYKATEAEQEAELSLLDKATAYEQENDLIDERMDYTDDCNLLVWFHHKYITQK